MARGNPNPLPPPKDKQFGQPNGNPRHNGAWKKEDTARYKLEQMMKLSEEDLLKVYNDTLAPLFERKLARAIKNGEWKQIESMINQVYGTPKQSIDMNHGGEIKTSLVEFIDGQPNKDTSTK